MPFVKLALPLCLLLGGCGPKAVSEAKASSDPAWQTSVVIAQRRNPDSAADYPRFEVRTLPCRLRFRTEAAQETISGEVWNVTKGLTQVFSITTNTPSKDTLDLHDIGTYELRVFASDPFFADLQVQTASAKPAK